MELRFDGENKTLNATMKRLKWASEKDIKALRTKVKSPESDRKDGSKSFASVGELSRLNTRRLIYGNAKLKSKVGASYHMDGENRSIQEENNELRRQLKSTREKASSLGFAVIVLMRECMKLLSIWAIISAF